MYGDRMKTYPYLITVLLAFFTGQVLAEANGPDFYKVRDVSFNDTLAIRAEPHTDAARLGEIPPDGTTYATGVGGDLDGMDDADGAATEPEKGVEDAHCISRVPRSRTFSALPCLVAPYGRPVRLWSAVL